MSNTASAILWPSAPVPAIEIESGSEWTFYTQVSVSGPSVSTTVHRGESSGVPGVADRGTWR